MADFINSMYNSGGPCCPYVALDLSWPIVAIQESDREWASIYRWYC